MPLCGYVPYMEMPLVMSAIYYVRKYMLRPSADSTAECEPRTGGNDGSASCIMQRASPRARRSLGTSVMQMPSFPWFKALEEIVF